LPSRWTGGSEEVLIRFKESVKVRLGGKELHSFKKGEIHNVSIAVVAVLLAQGFAEPVARPPAMPQALTDAA
jgi:hypothetical protein